MVSLNIRFATQDDVEAVDKIFTAQQKFLGFVMRKQLEESAANKRLLICEDKETGEVVGAVNFGVTQKGYITIYEIASLYEGRGIGRLLIDHLKRSKLDIKLKVTEDNLGAIAFYEKNGFELVSTEPGKKRRLHVMYYKTPKQKRLF